jgi:hypothetical protein
MSRVFGGIVQRAPAAPLTVNPVIELGNPPAVTPPVVVVKKSYTNPARTRITLKTSSHFRRSGTLSRTVTPTSGDIHIFTAATGGAEIDFVNNINTNFSSGQLNAGVHLFAEARGVSATAGDFHLILTLAAGPTPIGPPATVSLTAVELTLNVALSRAAAGVAPPVMSANDKINTGRFVQVRDPGFSHERAMITLLPPNPSVPVTMVLSAIGPAAGPAHVQAFGFETPAAGQQAQPNPVTFPSVVFQPDGLQLFVEGTAASTTARDTGFRLGIENLEPEADRVALTTVQVEMTDTAAPAAAAATFVRMGLWDNAFRAPGDPSGPLFNEELEANNVAGADTRRFHIRVRDVSASSADHVQVNWRTVDENNNNVDAPATRDITLVATAANSGVFISRGLVLVTDSDDQNQATHSGLSGTLPDAGVIVNQSARNHRMRKASLLGSNIAEYSPPTQAGTVLPMRLPVFQRTPESRRRLPLQIFVLRVAPGGAGVIPTAAGSGIWTVDLRVIRETYERIGMKAEIVVAPGTPAGDIVTNGSDSIVLVDPPAGALPSVSFADEAVIGASHPAMADTIRVFFVAGLSSGNGGETWSDAITTATDPKRGSAWVIQSTGPYAAAHEIGHALTNKQVAASACDPAAAARSHFCAPTATPGNRLQNDQNLMKRQFLGPEGVSGAKRIWDAADADAVNQFTAARGSHYTRNF